MPVFDLWFMALFWISLLSFPRGQYLVVLVQYCFFMFSWTWNAFYLGLRNMSSDSSSKVLEMGCSSLDKCLFKLTFCLMVGFLESLG